MQRHATLRCVAFDSPAATCQTMLPASWANGGRKWMHWAAGALFDRAQSTECGRGSRNGQKVTIRRAGGEEAFPLFGFCTAIKRRKKKAKTKARKRPRRHSVALCRRCDRLNLSFSLSQGFFVSIIYCYCNGEVSEGNTAVHQLIAAVLMRRNYPSCWKLQNLCLNPASHLNRFFFSFHYCSTCLSCSWKKSQSCVYFLFLVNKQQSAASNIRVQ